MTEMFEQVKVPVLFFMSRNDPSSVRETGFYFKILLKKNNGSRSILLADQTHGFANRGDLKKPKVKAAYEKVMLESLKFYHEHLGGDAPVAPATQ